MQRKIKQPPINWYGGKGGNSQRQLLNRILDLINSSKAERFVDVFGGSGVVCFNTSIKERVFNDKNSLLTQFFRILKDEDLRQEFQKKLTLTLYSEIEFIEAKERLAKETRLKDETESLNIDKVVDFYIVTMQSRNANGAMMLNQTWRCKGIIRRGMAMAVSSWLRNIDENLPNIVEDLREIEVTNEDVFNCLKRWDDEKTIFYLDPPYIQSTRKAKKAYGEFELEIDKHENIVRKLLEIKGQAIVSMYDSCIYNRLSDNGWKKEYKNVKTSSTIISDSKLNTNKKEVIWYNIRN